MTCRGWLAGAAALAVLATGCGDSESPADAVPALSVQLDRVDAAISAGRYGAARSALDDLTDETERARTDGVLGDADAVAILAAVSALEGQLPQPSEVPSATASAPSTATPSATPSVEPEEEKPEHAGSKPHPKHDKKPKPPKPDKKPHPKPGKKHGHKHGH